jgi:hypothetical protein
MAHVSVKVAKEPVFANSKAELEKMINSLDSFMKEAFMKIASGDMLKIDSEQEEVTTLGKDLDCLLIQSNHHQGGATAAKVRFMNMLQLKL